MFEKLGRFRTAIILTVFVTGLGVILLEHTLGPELPEAASLVLRTLFWLAAILYIAQWISARRSGHDKDQSD